MESAPHARGHELELIAGRYALQRHLARGGMGEVWSALDRSSGTLVALKRVRASAREQRNVVSDFTREYHALSLLRHPRIIEVYDFGIDDNRPFYTMELLDGQDLDDLSPLPFREACLYLRDVASSLALLHARRLLHRDVSPRNVRRTSDGRCKLIDFGAMIAFGVPPNVTGTPPCIAPEALQGAALDQRADLYSLGALAYRVLTGRYAHEARELDELPEVWKQPVLRPRRVASDIPQSLDDLVMSLLSLDPMKRPQCAAEVIDRLSAVGELPVDDTASAARSFLMPSRLCGRESARKLIARSIERARQGHGATILVEGPAGSGKSRMLQEAALLAQTSGLTAVRAVARTQHGTSYPLARDLVATLHQILPALAAGSMAGQFDLRRGLSSPPGRSAPQGDASELRTQLQQSLTDLFCNVAQTRPLLIAVDDLDRADEFSAALVTALAYQARGMPLVIVAARGKGGATQYPGSDASFAEIAERLQLSNLDRERSAELLESMFGPVPNLERLNDWTYRIADGNPRLTVSLAEHLLTRGVIRYVAGTWVLPSDEIAESVPPNLAEALALRMQALSAPALALAELLSVRRGGATAELCLAAAAVAASECFAALDELVREGVLDSAGDAYAFAQDELGQIVLRGLAPERSRELHRRWADVLLSRPSDDDPDLQLQAGWHLVHTEDELRGADLLARVAPGLVDRGLAMATALPSIEAALAIYERHERPLQTRLRLRATLVLSGFMFDYRLAARYGEETLAVLYQASGLAAAHYASRLVGPRLGFLFGLAAATLRRMWQPRARRFPPVITALTYFIRTAMGLMGVRAVALDVDGTRRVSEMMAPLAGSPNITSGPLMYMFARALSLQMRGCEAEVAATLKAARRLLERGRSPFVSEAEHQTLEIGLLTSDGLNECYRENSQASRRADALERIGTCLARTAAHRIRLIYALTQGELERAEECRRMIDLQGIQGGTTWQVEWFAAPIEGMIGGATWSDLVLVRRSLEKLRRLSESIPSLRPHLHSIEIAHHFRRGEFATAAAVGERYVLAYPPRTLTGWGASYAVTALALIEDGRAARAKELCDRALEFVSAEDRAYTQMYGLLEVARATALAVLGDQKQADEILQARIERLEAFDDHAGLVTLHEGRARIARLLQDRRGLMSALQSMQRAALAAGSPALVLLADRAADLGYRAPDSPIPQPAVETTPTTSRSTQQERAVTRYLRGCRSTTDHSRETLRMLARYSGSDEAYLFACANDAMSPVAALHDRSAPEQLTTKLRELIARAEIEVGAPVRMYSTELTRDGEAPARYRVLLLASEDQGYLGVAAVREPDTASAEVSQAVLADLSAALADDLQRETKRSRSKQSDV